MKLITLAVTSFAFLLPALAQERKTVYVDRMEGLESFVEKALENAELPFDFIEEEKKPEMKATLAKMHAAYGEITITNGAGTRRIAWNSAMWSGTR